LGNDAIRASNTFEGRVIAVAQGRYLIVVVNPVGGAAALLKQTAQNLK